MTIVASVYWRRPWFWAALVLPLAFGLAHYTQFRVHATIVVEAERILVTINGSEMSVPAQITHVTRVSALAAEPFEQFGGGSFSLEAPGQPGEVVKFPWRWTFPDAVRPPGGDWWIDRPVIDTEWGGLGGLNGSWTPPIRVDVDIPGRLARPIVIRFDGPVPFDCAIRYGLINNDVAIYFPGPDPRLVAQPLGGNPGFDGPHVIGPIAKGVFLGCLLVLAFSALGALDRSPAAPETGPGRGLRWLTFAVLGLVALRFGVSWWVADELFNRLPHFQDDLCYVLRAKWLLAGSVDRPIPPFAENFHVPFTKFFHDRWLTPFPILWSLMLVLGMKLGAPWLVPPACGALAVYFQHRLGQRIAGAGVGALGALLLALSPFAIILSGSLLNHSATGMFLVLFAWLFVKGWSGEGDGRPVWLLLSGVALGSAFGIRPLTAAALGAPTFLLGLYEWKCRKFSLRAFGGLVVFALGVALGSVPTLLDNAAVTGHPLLFAYRYLATERPLLELLPEGLYWSDRSMAQFPMLVTGWGWPWLRGDWWICLPFGFAAVPFLSGRANRHDWWLLGLFLSVVVAHFSHIYGTLHGFGPRIYADTIFALLLLVARGCDCLAR